MSDDAAPKQPTEWSSTLLIAAIFSPSPTSSAPLPQRLKTALSDNIPLLRDALLLQWTRRGTPLRALFVVSVGTIVFLALAGLLVFMCCSNSQCCSHFSCDVFSSSRRIFGSALPVLQPFILGHYP
ncbi:uncharacterized protein LOC121766914 [Salvia splendens]|uniref:uncharacterized protein LOC121766914 n=1 Tax=Salvia splendens TaxID=180675 RepID=UPI001C2647FB|nr:uncharacterized protein LOC121766914 [Salvia splendens]